VRYKHEVTVIRSAKWRHPRPTQTCSTSAACFTHQMSLHHGPRITMNTFIHVEVNTVVLSTLISPAFQRAAVELAITFRYAEYSRAPNGTESR